MLLHTFCTSSLHSCFLPFAPVDVVVVGIAIVTVAAVAVAVASSRKHFKCHFNYICSFVRWLGVNSTWLWSLTVQVFQLK